MEQQIIDTLNQYISQNPGYKLSEKALEQIHANAKSYWTLACLVVLPSLSA